MPGQNNDEPVGEEIIQATPRVETDEVEKREEEQSQTEILPLTPQSLVGSPSLPDSSFKKVSKRILIELMKGESA